MTLVKHVSETSITNPCRLPTSSPLNNNLCHQEEDFVCQSANQTASSYSLFQATALYCNAK